MMVLALLLGGFHAEADTISMTSGGRVDLSKFDEFERVFILKTAENMLYDSINSLPDDLDAKNGSLKYKKMLVFSFSMLVAEARRAGLEPLTKWNSFKMMNMLDNIHGTIDSSKALFYDEEIEEEKKKYFDAVLESHADKRDTTVPPEEMEDYSRRIKEDILAIAMEKVFGKK